VVFCLFFSAVDYWPPFSCLAHYWLTAKWLLFS